MSMTMVGIVKDYYLSTNATIEVKKQIIDIIICSFIIFLVVHEIQSNITV